VNNGSLQIVDCLVAGNSASYGGGVFQGNTGRVDVVDSRIELNQASVDGGGLYVNGDAALTNTQVLTNTANRHGGGLHVGSGRADVFGGTFAGNRATTGNGGGINLNNSISLSGTQFISNTAGQDGGGLLQWNAGQQVDVTGVRFERNHAARNGGGLCVSQGATATVISSVFVSNILSSTTVELRGGGAYVSGNTQVLSSTFRANRVTCSSCGYTYGGGLYNASTFSITVQDCLFESNSAWIGGGLCNGDGAASISGVTFSDNSAGYGGGVYASHVTIENSCFMHNDAEGRGGGLEAMNGATLTSTRFISNTSTEGGGLALYGSNTTMVNTVIVDNQASLRGSGLYIVMSPVQMLHTTIARNTGGDGSGVYVDYSSNVVMTNTILVNQMVGITATDSPDAMAALNGVLWYGNAANTDGGVNINVTNAITGTPAFAADGYHLTAASMAIDHGVNSGVTSDIDGDPRPLGAGYDIGADELFSIYLPLVLRDY
jgi:predicted outer membrane repeat protein